MAKQIWDLSDLYTNFQDLELSKDLNHCTKIQERYNLLFKENFKNFENPIESTEAFLKQLIEDTLILRKISSFAQLHFSVDANHSEALALKNKSLKFYSQLTEPTVKFKRWISEFDLKSIQSWSQYSSLIKEHLFFLEEMHQSSKHMLSSDQEVVISKLKLTGSSAWETLQNIVSAKLTVPFVLKGKKENLPIMTIRNFAFSSDPDLRKRAYEAELEAYREHEEASAMALNSIKGEVLTLSELRGFDSPLEEALFHSRMSIETLDALIHQMEEHLPIFRTYVKLKSRKLGHTKGMPFYDLFAPIVKGKESYSIDESMEIIEKQFEQFNPKLSRFAKQCYEKNWIDFLPKPGKRGGAFCSNIPSIKQSRVLLNHSGQLKNVLTLAHELGHAYHGECIMNESILNTNYPMPLAETASIFCETIVRDGLYKQGDSTTQMEILENSLSSATQVIMDILSRFYFEKAVFEKRADGPLSPTEYKELMTSCQKKAYGDALDPNTLHPYMWLNKPHYYSAGRSFYNFPYAFGLLFAKGLYKVYEKEGDSFIPKYEELLRLSGQQSVESVCQTIDIDPKQPNFWKNALNDFQKEVDAYEKQIKI